MGIIVINKNYLPCIGSDRIYKPLLTIGHQKGFTTSKKPICWARSFVVGPDLLQYSY